MILIKILIFSLIGFAVLGIFVTHVGASAEEKKQRYLKKHGRPKQSITFSDSAGNLVKLHGTDTLNKLREEMKDIKINNKNETK